jgi:hypothetical protein
MAFRTNTDPSPDPFDYESVPSLSWRDQPVGTIFTLEIVEPAKTLQSTDYESGEPAWWDAEKTRPKLCAVLNVKVLRGPHSEGEIRSIWAPIGASNLFFALKEAQSKAEAKFAPGGLLEIRFAGTRKHENPRFNDIKEYEAQYDPRGATLTPDPFVQPQQTQAPAPPAPQRPATVPSVPNQQWNRPTAPASAPAPAASGGGWRRR